MKALFLKMEALFFKLEALFLKMVTFLCRGLGTSSAGPRGTYQTAKMAAISAETILFFDSN